MPRGKRVSLAESEYAVLRETIAARGSLRIVIAAVTFFMWSAVALALVLFSELPVAGLLSLAVLIGGFECIHALHVGVERIGRYIQVFYEETSADEVRPQWETTAMKVGPALPGGGVDPLFMVLFLCATVVNLIPVFLPQPEQVEVVVISTIHLAFAARLIVARHAAAKQRAVELERYRSLLLRERDSQ
jgi:hypothetical protein